ncbi:PLDc N-terminal domain-containing protein [Actinoplanes sp. NPDC026619]|uniref:PLDc N-terminal domain-containing protein n=1 Tax=Actinoplanes sp. NPDC026619 TaxID=3155798 RepID=UPI0033E6C700
MVRVFIFLAALQLILFVLALISALSVERVRNAPRALWVLIIILIPLLGPLAYFLWGRPVAAPREGGPPAHRGSSRPSSPDDDPDFLRKMNSEQSRRDREALDRWEREFKKNGDDEK